MKTRNLFTWITACALALAFVAPASAQTKERTAKVVRVKGAVRSSTDGGATWQQITVGQNFRPGVVIQTAADSFVDIVLTESAGVQRRTSIGEYVSFQPSVQQDVIRVDNDSVLAIDRLTTMDTGADTVNETELDLRSGRIMGAVRKASAASTFEVKIPNGVAGIRGTIFSISALGIISVLQGAVSLAYNSTQGPQSETVQAGFEFDARTGNLSPLPPTIEQLLQRFVQRGFVTGPPQLDPRDATNEHVTSTVGADEGNSNGEDNGGVFEEGPQ